MPFEVDSSCYCSVPQLLIYIFICPVAWRQCPYLTIFIPCPTENCTILCWFSATFVPSDLLYSHKIKLILWQFPSNCHLRPCPPSVSHIPCAKPHVHFTLLKSFQKFRPSPKPCVTFCNIRIFLRCGGLVPSFNHQSGGSPFISSPRLLMIVCIFAIIRHIRRTAFTPPLFFGTITNITKNIKRLLSMFGHVSTFSTVCTCSLLLSVS